MNYNKTIHLRLTVTQDEYIQALAARKKITKSEAVRTIIDKQVKKRGRKGN